MINGHRRTHKKRKKTTVYPDCNDTQQSNGWSILHPQNFFIQKGQLDTNKYRNLFILSCPQERKKEAENFGVLEWLFSLSLNWFIPMKIQGKFFGVERWTHRIFQPSVIHHLRVCIHSERTTRMIPLGFKRVLDGLRCLRICAYPSKVWWQVWKMTIDAHQLQKGEIKLFLMTSKRFFKWLGSFIFVGGIANNVRCNNTNRAFKI